MIIDNLNNISKYSSIPQCALNFLKTLNIETPVGKYELADGCYANIDEYRPKILEECKFEAHKKYIDIQMVLKGEEEIHIVNIKNLTVSEEYNPQKDIMFFENIETDVDKIALRPLKFVLIYPHEAHKPQIKTNTNYIKKVVVKIPID